MANLSHDQRSTHHDVIVDVDRVKLPGYLWTPPDARGLVVFAHGSGSGRDSRSACSGRAPERPRP